MSECNGQHRYVLTDFDKPICDACGWEHDSIELVDRINADSRKIATLTAKVAATKELYSDMMSADASGDHEAAAVLRGQLEKHIYNEG